MLRTRLQRVSALASGKGVFSPPSTRCCRKGPQSEAIEKKRVGARLKRKGRNDIKERDELVKAKESFQYYLLYEILITHRYSNYASIYIFFQIICSLNIGSDDKHED